jgi:S1-C subfamily serine protease
VRPGSIISEVNGQSVKGVADFERAIKSAKPGTYVRLYTLVFGPRGERAPNFAVVQVP